MKKIESISNSYIKELAKLTSKRRIIESGMFLIEGRNIIKESIERGIVLNLLVTEENFNKDLDIEQIIVPSHIIEKLSTNQSNKGIIGVAKYKPLKADINLLNKVVVLDGVNNPGNLGTIIRGAKAFGYECIFILNDSVFPYNEKVIRSSQGSIFDIPVLHIQNLEYLVKFQPIYFTLDEKSTKMENIEPRKPFALVFGNEANGISSQLTKNWKGVKAYIEVKNIESLNLSSAASIAMYKFK